MPKQSISFIALLAIFLMSLPTNLSAANPRALIGYWKMDELSGNIISDSSGYKHDGALQTWSGIYGQRTAGKLGGSVEFNGNKQFASITASSDLDVGSEVTMAAWVNLNAYTNAGKFITHHAAYELAQGLSGRGTVRIAIWRPTQNDWSWIDTGVSYLPLNTWHWVVGTYDGSSMKLYVDGNLVGTKPLPGSIKVISGPVTIGGDRFNENMRWTNGKIDESAIWNYALSETEIRQIFQNYLIGQGLTLTPPPLPAPTPPPSNPPLTIATEPTPAPAPAPGCNKEIPLVYHKSATYPRPTKLYSIPDRTHVWAVFGSKRHPIPTPTIFNSYQYSWGSVVPSTRSAVMKYPEARFVKIPSSPIVYLLSGSQWLRRSVPSPAVFESYDYEWKDIITISPHDLNFYPEATLIKSDNKPGVYKVECGEKRLITSEEAFERNGFDWNDIMVVTESHVMSYPSVGTIN